MTWITWTILIGAVLVGALLLVNEMLKDAGQPTLLDSVRGKGKRKGKGKELER